MSSITQLLARIDDQPQLASTELLPLVYEELRRLARSRLRHEAGVMTLPATALVHEAWLRLVGDEPLAWDNRGHFFAAAAEAMRRVALDYARAARSRKRGGDLQRVTLNTLQEPDCGAPQVDLIDLDRSLSALEALDPAMSQVVKLRYYGGLSIEETAAALGFSTRTVSRHWRAARAWLNRALASS